MYFSRRTTKPTKWHVRPAKTQIGIRPVWSETLLSVWRNIRPLTTHWVHSEDSDQTGWMPRLIWVFAGRTCHFVGFVVQQLIYFIFQFPSVSKPKTLEKQYQGILSSVLVDFMQVCILSLHFRLLSIRVNLGFLDCKFSFFSSRHMTKVLSKMSCRGVNEDLKSKLSFKPTKINFKQLQTNKSAYFLCVVCEALFCYCTWHCEHPNALQLLKPWHLCIFS